MVLDYSKLEFDKDGRPEMPQLMLRTLSGESLGVLKNVSNLKLNAKFSEPSEITFELSKKATDLDNTLYDAVTGYKVIYTKCYGIYVILNPDTTSDGISEVKSVTGYSLEKILDSKKIFVEEGTFNFWNPVSTENTILGRILEIATGWTIGYVAPNLIGRYRTFDSCDDYLLSYVYSTLPEKFRCAFVFDPYNMTIDVYDVDEERPALPVYLDFDNLIEEVKIEELTDEMITAISPYGADDLDIRMVNPIGTNWIYDLSYFVYNGDIETSLAEKWESWQRSILTNQSYYNGLVALRASATAQLLTLQAALTDLEGELENYTIQQSVTIQQLALETTSSGIAYQEAQLLAIKANVTAKEAEIAAKEKEIAEVEDSLDSENTNSYNGQILAVVNTLAFSKYFTEAEQLALSPYFIEQSVTESTFVASDVTATTLGETTSIASGTLSVTGSTICEINFVSDLGKRMFTLEGGSLTFSGSYAVTGDIVRATIEIPTSGSFVASFYLGSVTADGTTSSGGSLTLIGTAGTIYSDITTVTVDEISEQLGSWVRFGFYSSQMYLTTSVTDYQKYAVQMELYQFAVDALDDLSSPTYEFTIDSGNIIFAKQFAPFREQLELGKCVYLNLGNGQVITPIMIEYELDFEDFSKFSIIFSNRFKRHDDVNTLKDLINTSYNTSRSFDASQYIYSQTVGTTSSVSKFLSDSLDAAKNNILAASNLSVVINGAGIQVGGESDYQLRIVDNMIAMTDDGWASAKLAIGLFSSSEVGEYWGVNADVIGGKLLIGNNLIIETEKEDGSIAAFRVDASGASLYNATFDIYDGTNARHITLNPDVGFAIGAYPLYSSNNVLNTDNAKFWVDMDGNVHINGTLYGCDGTFTGELVAATGTFSGELSAATGTFSGTVQAEDFVDKNGNSMLNSSGQFTSDYLSLLGLDVGNGAFVIDDSGNVTMKNAGIDIYSGSSHIALHADFGIAIGKTSVYTTSSSGKKSINTTNANLYVDQSGNLTVKGSIVMGAGSSISWTDVDESDSQSFGAALAAQNAASAAQTTANSASSAASAAQTTANSAVSAAATAAANASDAADKIALIASGKYYDGTYIDGKCIYSPEIYSSKIYAPDIYANRFTVTPPTDTTEFNGGFSLYGKYQGVQSLVYDVTFANNNAVPYLSFSSAIPVYADWQFSNTYFQKSVAFYGSVHIDSAATVKISGETEFYGATNVTFSWNSNKTVAFNCRTTFDSSVTFDSNSTVTFAEGCTIYGLPSTGGTSTATFG